MRGGPSDDQLISGSLRDVRGLIAGRTGQVQLDGLDDTVDAEVALMTDDLGGGVRTEPVNMSTDRLAGLLVLAVGHLADNVDHHSGVASWWTCRCTAVYSTAHRPTMPERTTRWKPPSRCGR